MSRSNWAGNYTYRARRLHTPSSLDELREVVVAAPRVRVLGSRHSFSDIADSDELVSLAGLPADVVSDGSTVSFNAGLKYGELVTALDGMALHNLASLPHISVGGAVATATHGSGDGNGNLATAVAALELLTSHGELVRAARGEPDFDGMVVHLGALGAVTRLTLDVEPAYEIRQRVFEDLSWDALLEHLDEILAAAYSVSVFSRLGASVEQVWLKSRSGDERDELFGARPAPVERHPILALDPVNTTPQRGRPGPWSDRLPHFRMGFTPSNGDELQSEYHVPREHGAEAIRALLALGERIAPRLQVAEFRSAAADELWMSPQYRRDTLSLHFTWMPVPIDDLLIAIEAALEPFDARPHWGKLFHAPPGGRYERLPDFLALMERLDPRAAFRNAWLERVLAEVTPAT